MAGKLTVHAIQALKPKDKIYKIFDGGGLHLRISPNGEKRWCVKYYDAAGKEKLTSNGTFPEVSLKAARAWLAEVKEQLKRGVDPTAKRKEEREAQAANARTFRMVAEQWDRTQNANLDPEHHKRIWARLEKDVFPVIGNRAIAEIVTQEIKPAFESIVKRQSLDVAHRVARMVVRIFDYGVDEGYISVNPASRLPKTLPVKPPVKHRRGERDPVKLGPLLRAMDNYSGENPIRYALRLMPMLACRSRELREAEWTDVDFTRGLYTIPASRMKMREPHQIPLSHQALAIFREAYENRTNERYVFYSYRRRNAPKPVITAEGLGKALHSCEGGEKLDIHGFRSTLRTVCREQLKAEADALEEAIAHGKNNPLGDAYDRTKWLDERREIAQRWSDYLDDLKAGVDPAAAAEKYRFTR